MAELLAGVVMTAVQTVAQRAAPQAGSGEAASSEAVLNATQLLAAVGSTRLELPPPLVPGNAENPTTLCAMQVGMQGLGAAAAPAPAARTSPCTSTRHAIQALPSHHTLFLWGWLAACRKTLKAWHTS